MANNPPTQGPDTEPAPRTSASLLLRELLFLGVGALCGFLVVPLLIWVVGNRILGSYVHTQDPTAGTGPMRLLADFFSGLMHGSTAFWVVAAGPFILISLVRLLIAYLRSPLPNPASAGRR